MINVVIDSFESSGYARLSPRRISAARQRTLTIMREHPAKKVVLFDNDGTISDSVSAVVEATNQALSERGFPACPKEQIIAGMRISTVRRMMDHVNTGDVDLAKALAEDFYTVFRTRLSRITIFDGVADSIEALHHSGYVLGMVSNNMLFVLETVTEQYGIRPLFSLLIGEDNAEETKPAPGGLLQACRLLGVKPDQALYIGDSLSDALAARHAGMASIGVKWNHHDSADIDSLGFSHTVESPRELPPLVRKILPL